VFHRLTERRYSNQQDKGAATAKVYSVITHLHTNKVVYKRLLSDSLSRKCLKNRYLNKITGITP